MLSIPWSCHFPSSPSFVPHVYSGLPRTPGLAIHWKLFLLFCSSDGFWANANVCFSTSCVFQYFPNFSNGTLSGDKAPTKADHSPCWLPHCKFLQLFYIIVCWLQTKHSTTRYTLCLIMSLASNPLLLPELFALTTSLSCFLSTSCHFPPVLHFKNILFSILFPHVHAPLAFHFAQSLHAHALHASYILTSALFSCLHRSKKQILSPFWGCIHTVKTSRNNIPNYRRTHT